MNTLNEAPVPTLPVRRVLPVLVLGMAALFTAGSAFGEEAFTPAEPLLSADRVIDAARSERPALRGDASSAAEASRTTTEALKAERMQNKAPSGDAPARRGVVAGADMEGGSDNRVGSVTITGVDTGKLTRFDVVVIDGAAHLMLRSSGVRM